MNVKNSESKILKKAGREKHDKKAVPRQGSDVSSKKDVQPLYDEILRRLEIRAAKTLVTRFIDEYASSQSNGRRAKVLAQVVPDLVFREIQEALKAKPIWFRKPGEAKANPASIYWFRNRGQWWGGLWNALEPEFEDLMTPVVPPWNVRVQRLIEKVLESALKEPGRGPTVLQVPPGLGKTTGTIEALCRPVLGRRAQAKGQHLRILWFVRESRVTEKSSGRARVSLGSEVLAEFKRCGASAQVIESQRDAASWTAQRKRGPWQTNASQPEVRILAHAHLPLMFRSAGAAGSTTDWLNSLRQRADLVVIDEDPVQSLVFTETDLSDLPVWPELVELMEAAGVLRPAEGALKCPRRPAEVGGQKEAYWEPRREDPDQLFRGTYQRMTLEDHDAWMRLWADTLTVPARKATVRSSAAVWDAFGHELLGACIARWRARQPEKPSDARVNSERQVLKTKLADFIRALRFDLLGCLKGATSTLRFGLLWVPDQDEPAQVQLRLRFSFLKPLVFTGHPSGATLPVVILDAYADEDRYQTVFGPSTSLERLEHDAAFELQVEQLDLAKELQKFTVTTGFAQRHLLRLMTLSTLFLLDEHQRLPRRVLFLGPQAVTSHQHVQRHITPVISAQESYQFAHRWLHYLTPVEESTDTGQRFQSAYWFAGRGRNQFAGSDVVALSPPRYPRQYQDQLAAVAPQTMADEEKRQRLSRHDEIAELLQMLHRGRQVLRHLQRPGKVAPRVIILFGIEDIKDDLQGKATVRPLEPRTVDLPKHLNQVFLYDQLGGLPLKDEPNRDHPEERGKLELTKLVGVGVLMELLGRANRTRPRRRVQFLQEPALPEGWFPERLLVRLGLLGKTRSDTVSEDMLIRAYLDQLELPTATPHSAPSFRFTTAALQRAGLWETMPLGKKVDPQAWAPPGTGAYLKPQLQAFFEERFKRSLLVERHPLSELGVIWRLAETDVGEIQTWSHLQIQRLRRQDRGGQEKKVREKRTAL